MSKPNETDEPSTWLISIRGASAPRAAETASEARRMEEVNGLIFIIRTVEKLIRRVK
jgi:hypothetical protein